MLWITASPGRGRMAQKVKLDLMLTFKNPVYQSETETVLVINNGDLLCPVTTHP